jgi:alpha-D-xyloside xylohydrolase
MRAMLLEFPDDPACDTLDRPYLLGESLLVAPVFSRDNVVEYYVPEGRWTKYLTGEVAEGPRWVRETHGFLSVPLLVRPNTVLPVGAREDRPDYDFADGVTFQVYQSKDGRSVVPTFQVTRRGNEIRAEATNAAKPWRLLLVGVSEAADVTKGAAESGEKGLLMTPDTAASGLTIRLPEGA